MDEARLCRLLADVARSVRMVESDRADCCGLTWSQCRLLLAVSDHNRGVSPGCVASELGLDPSTVTRVADGLERRGLIARRQVDGDRRRTLLAVTGRGQKLVDEYQSRIEEYARGLARRIPPRSLPLVINALEIIRDAHEKMKGECPPVSEDIKKTVRERYGKLARQVLDGGSMCCGQGVPVSDSPAACCGPECGEGLSAKTAGQSLGCGDPIAAAELKPGETVLDLGSGAGLDVLRAAGIVGDAGRVYGLDMTDDMLKLARRNQEKSGATNVEFLKAEMEDIPLPADSVDVIVSNCVVNLSPDKERVLAECYRVLKPGGRLAIFDLMWRGKAPAGVKEDARLWCECIGGALVDDEYVDLLGRAGFESIELDVAGRWSDPALSDALTGTDCTLVSACVRARKHAPAS